MAKEREPLKLIPLDELKKVLAKIIPPVLPKDKGESKKAKTKQKAR